MKNFTFDIETIKKCYGNADFGFCIFNVKGDLIFCNKKLLQLTGLTEKNIRKTRIHELFTDSTTWEKVSDAIAVNGTVYEYSFSDEGHYKTTLNIHFDSLDKDYFIAFFFDVSELSRLKKDLSVAEKRISIAHKAADIGSWEYDYKTGLLHGSDKAYEILGEPVLATGVSFDLILELVQDKTRVEKEFYDFIRGEKPYDTIYKINQKNSQGEKTIYSYGSIFKDSSGNPERAVGYIKDITSWLKMEEKVRYEENLIDTYLNFVGTIIVMLDSEGRVTFLNKKGTDVLGYALNEILGKDWVSTVIPKEDRKYIDGIRKDIYKQKAGKWSVVENYAVTSSGEKRIIRWNNSVIRNENNEVTGTISSGEDITNIKLNEKKLIDNEQSLKQAEKKAKMGHWVRKPGEDILVWSDGLYQMFGYEIKESPAGVDNSLLVIHEDDRERYQNLIKRAVEFGESYSIDMRGIKKDGEIFYIRVDADVTLGEDGKTSVIYGIVTDITETHNRIKELEEAKNRLDLAEAMSKTGHWQRNLKTNTYIFSDELYRIFGIDEGVKLITHELLHERFHPDDRKKISDFTEEKLKIGEDYSFEGRIQKPDGSVSFIEAYVQVKKDISGEPFTANGVMRDITELKTHERKLLESEFQLKRAEEISGTGNWIMDLKTGRYTCSDNFYKICGFDPESTEATFESIMSATHPEDIDRINGIIAESMKTGEDYEFENRLILPDGSIRYVRSKGTYIKDKKGRPKKSVGTLLDITEFKKTETILIESKEKLEKAEEIARVGHWEKDFKTGKSYWSDEIYRVFGYEPQSFEASEPRYINIIHPDDIAVYREHILSARKDRTPLNVELRIIKKDSDICYIRIRGNFLLENGEIVKTFGTIEDITDEKLREYELLEKNRMLDEAEAVSHVGHFINDYKKGTRYWSDEMYRILGYDPKADIDKNTLYKKLMDPEDFKKNVELMNKAIESKKSSHESNFAINDAYGNRKYLKHLYRFRYENDEHIASFGVVQDMTEVKTHYEDMEYMNYHDALTDLYNRRYFDEAFTEIDVPENYPLSVITADINGLKMTNDTISHSAGDRLIMKAARVLKSVCEERDMLARIGGDDFILVMPLTTQSQAEMVMNELHELFAAANEEIPISVSMGLAVKLKADKSKEDFLKEAEDNMYTSKLYEKTSKRGDLLRLIMDTLYERSSREEKHSERVSNYCGEMGKALKMPKYKVNELTALGLLHDIGKIAVKDSVLNKADKLDEEEWLEIRKHSETGYRILSQSPGMLQASKYVLAHHERWDGKGYPQGLKTYEIPTQARIISICDAFDAMRSKRPYRDPMPLDEAVSEIRKGAGTQFDPELAKVFVVQVLGEKW